MSLFELFAIAVGLSMDAFAVSVCKGLSMPRMRWKHAFIIALWFGAFQALMPAIGYALGFLLAVATSIDALAVGVTFAFLQVHIVAAVCFIGIVTFVCSCIGVRIGNLFGARFKSKAELAGGLILIAMGFKILIEHLFFS